MEQKFNIVINDIANSELQNITELHLRLSGQVSSLNILKQIKKSIFYLADNPYMGMDAKKLGIRKISYRYIICGNYLCFYKVDRKNTIVEIAHIVDGRTDYIKNFEW